MEEKYRRIENIHELDEIKSKTLVKIPKLNGFHQGVFIKRINHREVLLFTRNNSNSNFVNETYCDAESNGDFPYQTMPSGTDFCYHIRSWRGRRINRVLSRAGI